MTTTAKSIREATDLAPACCQAADLVHEWSADLASFVDGLAGDLHKGQHLILLHKLTEIANQVSAATRLVCRLSDNAAIADGHNPNNTPPNRRRF